MAHSNPLKKATEGMDHALVSIYFFSSPCAMPGNSNNGVGSRDLKNPLSSVKKAEKEFDGC